MFKSVEFQSSLVKLFKNILKFLELEKNKILGIQSNQFTHISTNCDTQLICKGLKILRFHFIKLIYILMKYLISKKILSVFFFINCKKPTLNIFPLFLLKFEFKLSYKQSIRIKLRWLLIYLKFLYNFIRGLKFISKYTKSVYLWD